MKTTFTKKETGCQHLYQREAVVNLGDSSGLARNLFKDTINGLHKIWLNKK